jgi:ABC-type multidrug transport system permease subunit
MVAGTFERLVVSPFGAVGAILAMLAFPVGQALVVAAVTVGFAGLAFGMPIAWPDILLSPLAAALGALAFAPFGVLTLATMLVVKQTLAAVSILITALSIAAGVYFPVDLLPQWIQWVSEVQPFTPALDLLRHMVTATSTTGSAWADVGKLVAFTAVLGPVSLWALLRALARSRQRGTITEY